MPSVKSGEILPFFGRLYQASGIPPVSGFKRLPADEIPPKCDVQRKGTCIVPLARNLDPTKPVLGLGLSCFAWGCEGPR